MSDEQSRWVPTGEMMLIGASVNRIPPFDRRNADHLWTWTTVFRAGIGTETSMLDAENLILVAGPACYYCEQIYTPQLSQRRCSGQP